MANAAYHLTTIAVLAVLVVLLLGLWNMRREDTASLSQKLMRWRVGLQFFAVLAIMLTLWLRKGAG